LNNNKYENKDSLMIHTDWHESRVNGMKLCTILDEASRKILAAWEFNNLILRQQTRQKW